MADKREQDLSARLGKVTEKQVELDLIGVDASIANAYRRTLLAEVGSLVCAYPISRLPALKVPTVAVENVYVWNNTSIVQDEVLSQRLGLVPLKIDPSKVEFKNRSSAYAFLFALPQNADVALYQAGDEPTDVNTIVFNLVIKCDRLKAKANETDPDKLYKNANGRPPVLRIPVIRLKRDSAA